MMSNNEIITEKEENQEVKNNQQTTDNSTETTDETQSCQADCMEEESGYDKLSKENEELKQKVAEQNDAHLRLMAEYDNYRRRTLKEKADLIKSGGENALRALLTVIDDFERALQAVNSATEVEPLKDGVNLIYHKFTDYLKQNNVAVIDTNEAPFDTEFHEAITTIPAPSEQLKGKIVDCIQKGYTLNEKVIRFAKVVVGE